MKIHQKYPEFFLNSNFAYFSAWNIKTNAKFNFETQSAKKKKEKKRKKKTKLKI